MVLPVTIKFYTRNKCHLCEKAKLALIELQSELDFEIEEVDIDTNDLLTELYGLMIPVVEIDGEEVQYGQVEKEVIRKRLQERFNIMS